MRALLNKLPRWTLILGLAAALATPQLALANGNGNGNGTEESPTAFAMAGDLLIARPFLLLTTVGGTLIYVISLPFSLAGGNAKESAQALVVEPAKATFVRCLGCTKTGRKAPVIQSGD